MADLGWSYPAGCSGPPDGAPEPSELQDALWQLLEDAGMPEDEAVKVCKLVEEWERRHESAEAEAELN